MFDVRPVNQSGDLDWEKIRSVSGSHHQEKKQKEIKAKSPVKTYILGVGIENEKAPIFYDPEFDLEEILEFEVKNRQDEFFLEEKRMALEEKHRLISEKLAAIRKEKEAAIIAERIKKQQEKEKREELLRIKALQEKEYLRKIEENNRKIKEEREKALLEKERELEKEKNLWLEEELKSKNEFWEQQKDEASEYEDYYKLTPPDESKFLYFWKFLQNNLFPNFNFSLQFDARTSFVTFAAVALILSLTLGGVSFASKGFGLKEKVLGISQEGFSNLSAAVDEMNNQNFEASAKQLSEAYDNFSEATENMNSLGSTLVETSRFIPFASELSSGKNAVEAGKHFSAAGQYLNDTIKTLAGLKNPLDVSNQNNASLLDIFQSIEKNITDAKKEFDAAQENMDKISIDDLPKEKQNEFLILKQKLPEIRNYIDSFLNNSHIFVDLLGGNGPRKYLLLFQNNSEMRATGGFIGSYGLIGVTNGQVKNFFIDGIFNPDGQLKEKIVPPKPIQKISATWSLHDSNWFPDFPTSAEKAIYFYEKTGGPTAEGIITFTPTFLQKLLDITGPIDMPDYDVTLDSENFIELTQYEVEVDYDKKENKPKKILSDLAPIIIEKLLDSKDMETISKTAAAFSDGLEQKYILLYSQNKDLQEIISKQGWSGEILSAPKDYLSVINTNINGFKTDAVIQESIKHEAEIQQDGSVIDTVTITRKHTGGNSEYGWLNKVNADYMRIYVPEGSKLLETTGQTRETNEPPLDYNALGFKRDSNVQREEENIEIDPNSGTRIYKEAGKTVFANWVYVSPQETVTITYKYILPFSLFKVKVGNSQQIDSYSLVIQKQSGSTGSLFVSNVSYPENYSVKWNYPDDIEKNINDLEYKTTLETDHFRGVVFEKN